MGGPLFCLGLSPRSLAPQHLDRQSIFRADYLSPSGPEPLFQVIKNGMSKRISLRISP